MRKVKENRNCPYCLSPVETDEERVRCPKCGVVHHADCWKANGSCSVYGCDGWAVWSSQISERIAPSTESAVDVLADKAKVKTKQDTSSCIKCGAEIKSDQLVCWKCRRDTNDFHFFENCFGPSIVVLCGITGILTLIVKALT